MNADLGGELSGIVIGAAIDVHREIGPGLLEAVYEDCLAYELDMHGIAQKIDLIVENRLVVEIKAVEHVTPLHDAQVLTYLRLSGYDLGLLINFNSVLLKDGVRRFALSSRGH